MSIIMVFFLLLDCCQTVSSLLVVVRGLRLDQVIHVPQHLVNDFLLRGDGGHGFDGRSIFLSGVASIGILRILLMLRWRLQRHLVAERVCLRELLI